MSDSFITDPVLGRLTAVPDAPPDASFWQGAATVADEAVPFYVVGPPGAPPSPATLEAARHAHAAAAALVATAEARVDLELSTNPENLGLPESQARAYLKRYGGPPVEQPELTVHPDGSVYVRFADGALPCCDPYGLGVRLVGGVAVSVDNLEDSEAI